MSEDLPKNEIIQGDCRKVMKEFPPNSIDFVMFSPPYWGLRDYGEEAETIWGGEGSCEHSWKGQLGLEPDYRMYIQHLVEVGEEIKRILKPTGSWYLNLGDTYAGSGGWTGGGGQSDRKDSWNRRHVDSSKSAVRPQLSTDIKPKCKMLMPYRVALALIDGIQEKLSFREKKKLSELQHKYHSLFEEVEGRWVCKNKDKAKKLDEKIREIKSSVGGGWICRNDIIWEKPNPMPSSVKDRLNTTTERIFHFVQQKNYYYDLYSIREPHKESSIERNKYPYNSAGFQATKCPREDREKDVVVGDNEGLHQNGKNPGDVFEINTQPFPECHFAVYPPKLAQKPIKSSCPPKVCAKCGKPYEREVKEKEIESNYKDLQRNDERAKKAKEDGMHTFYTHSRRGVRKERDFKGWKKTCDCSTDKTRSGVVLDPMCGAGSTLVKAKELDRNYIGIEISEKYAEIAKERLKKGDERYRKQKRKERKRKREAEKITDLNKFT